MQQQSFDKQHKHKKWLKQNHKSQLPVSPSKAHPALEMHLVKCQDGKSIKHCLEAQHEHTMTILPIDDQKLAAEQLNYKKLFECDF